MTVELAKVVHDRIIQRARFTITRIAEDEWLASVVLYRDGAQRDAVCRADVATEGDAVEFVYRTVLTDFLRFTDEELAGAELSWGGGAYDDTPEAYIDLANLIASSVEEALAEEREELELDEQREAGEPLTWGTLDYASGEFIPEYVEYPGTLAKIVYADGSVEYLDDDRNSNEEGAERVR